jgi:hypothetical protein
MSAETKVGYIWKSVSKGEYLASSRRELAEVMWDNMRMANTVEEVEHAKYQISCALASMAISLLDGEDLYRLIKEGI